jgi:hypothetical protein
MKRGATVMLALAGTLIASSAQANCYTTQSVTTHAAPNAGQAARAPSPTAAAQFRIARRVDLVEWARSEKGLSASEAAKLDELRAKVDEHRAARRWPEAEEAINQAMKLLGIVNRAEAPQPDC